MDDAAENVILVDRNDRPVGTAAKLDAHRRGQLHRAFSVLVHDGAGNLLLQKRHPEKYHSGGLWTNTCCGHPRPGEETAAAATRRLAEEMGFACALLPIGTHLYQADVGGGLIEHELVHLFCGEYTGDVRPNAREAEATAWRAMSDIRREAKASPERFTVWFRRYLAERAQLAGIEVPAQT